jgi:hypothetical protein
MQNKKDQQSRRNVSLAKAERFAAGSENVEARTRAKQAILQVCIIFLSPASRKNGFP